MDFVTLVQECAPWASPHTMAAIVKTESGFNPLAIGVNGGARLARQPISKEEAVVTATWLIEKGYSIDMGLGQINSANLRKLSLSVEDIFDPCKNIAASATILNGSYQSAKTKMAGSQQALLAAISAYNTGNMTAGFNNGYVQKVVANAGKPIPSAKVVPGTPSATTPIKGAQAPSKQAKRLNEGQGHTEYINEEGVQVRVANYRLTYQ